LLRNLLQSIDIARGTDSLSGFIDDDANYQATYGHPFDSLLLAMPPYNLSIIASNASDTVRVKGQSPAPHLSHRKPRPHLPHHQGGGHLVAAPQELNPLYNKVPLQDMFQHLATSTAGLEATDIASLFINIQ
jgi:hypothetical protein